MPIPLLPMAMVITAGFKALQKMAEADRAEFEAQVASSLPSLQLELNNLLTPQQSLSGEIEKLEELHKRGILTEKEFPAAKEALIKYWRT